MRDVRARKAALGASVTGDPFGDLTACKPDPRPTPSKGGTGKKRGGPKQQDMAFIEKKREQVARKKKLAACRVCPNPRKLKVQAHHIVGRGVGGNWDHRNIIGLCLECHTKYHAADGFTRKAIRMCLTDEEVEYAEQMLAYPGYVDKNYHRLPNGGGDTLALGMDVASIKGVDA